MHPYADASALLVQSACMVEHLQDQRLPDHGCSASAEAERGRELGL